MVKISIVIPNYNGQEDLLKALKSVYSQNFKDFEVIVVDDCSIDDSVVNVKKSFPKTKVIVLAKESGPAIARNTGIKKSIGKYIINLDTDESFYNTNNFQDIFSKFENDRNIDVLAFKILDENTFADQINHWWHPLPIKEFSNKEFFTDYFAGGSVAFRRELFKKIGYYPEEFFISGEENDLAFRILDAGSNIFYFPKVALLHKKHDASKRHAYYQRKNQLWLVIKYFPFWKGIIFIAPRIIKSIFTNASQGNLSLYFKGLYDGIKGMPHELKLRKPLKKETWRRIRLIRQGKYNPETFKKDK